MSNIFLSFVGALSLLFLPIDYLCCNRKECFESIFHNTLTHFTHKPRRDCIHNNRHVPLSHQYLSTIDPFYVDHVQLCENLKTARQILGNEVSTAMLVSLTESILSEKGPLPVGEVGKMLQEATANPHLSQMLKDKHNGLKKFLEKFSELFIMSNDHPFNPHVYLRSNFTIQEQRLLEAGSTEILAAFKKAKVSPKIQSFHSHSVSIDTSSFPLEKPPERQRSFKLSHERI